MNRNILHYYIYIILCFTLLVSSSIHSNISCGNLHIVLTLLEYDNYNNTTNHTTNQTSTHHWIIDYLAIFHSQIQNIQLSKVMVIYPWNKLSLLTLHLLYPKWTFISSNVTFPLPNSGIGRYEYPKEHVSEIMQSIEFIIQEDSFIDKYILSISIEKESILLPSNSFSNICNYQSFPDIELVLLHKNQKLSSVSDWHDLSLIWFKNSITFHLFYSKFREVFLSYASHRKYFMMLDPRPALMEAVLLPEVKKHLKYFDIKDACSTTGTVNDKVIGKQQTHDYPLPYHPFEESQCSSPLMQVFDHNETKYTSSIIYFCGSNNLQCLVLNEPLQWKSNISSKLLNIDSFFGLSNNDILQDPIYLLPKGLLRFRNTTGHKPNEFCWSKGPIKGGLSTEKTSLLTKIEFNISHFEYFDHKQAKHYYDNYKSSISFLMITGTSSKSKALDKSLYLTLSKLYYCKRHHINYSIKFSEEYVTYFHKDLFETFIEKYLAKDNYKDMSYFKNVMTKPLMILDTMYHHLDKDWIVWTDDDIHINSDWLYMPLDVFLQDVPHDKVIIMSNFMSVMNCVLFIRNNIHGRQVIRDWLAIIQSGYIQNHGYDQAALQMLILQYLIDESYKFNVSNPMNYSCCYKKYHPGNKYCYLEDKEDTCDYQFEINLSDVGFNTKYIVDGIHGEKLSSYSKGCLNSQIKHFHIITETSYRPRLLCLVCTRRNEIFVANSHENALGGCNDKLRKGSINSYFFNHKSEFLMYESYLNLETCYRMPNLLRPCRIEKRHAQHLVSLVDNIAVDLSLGRLCHLNSEYSIIHRHYIREQVNHTYMNIYNQLIDRIDTFNETYWKEIYENGLDVDARSQCKYFPLNCPFGIELDGQQRSRPISYENISDSDMKYFDWAFFESLDMCSKCVNVSSQYDYIKYAVSCDCEYQMH